MDPNLNIPWLAITKPATKKLKFDLINKNLTNSDIAVLMFIIQKMSLTNEYKSPTQETLKEDLNLSKHRLSVAYTNLKKNGYFLKLNQPKKYMINPYLFYIGSPKYLTSKRNKWNKLWEQYANKTNNQINMEKFVKTNDSIFDNLE